MGTKNIKFVSVFFFFFFFKKKKKKKKKKIGNSIENLKIRLQDHKKTVSFYMQQKILMIKLRKCTLFRAEKKKTALDSLIT